MKGQLTRTEQRMKKSSRRSLYPLRDFNYMSKRTSVDPGTNCQLRLSLAANVWLRLGSAVRTRTFTGERGRRRVHEAGQQRILPLASTVALSIPRKQQSVAGPT